MLYAFTASFAAQLAMFSFFRIQARHPHWEAKGELGINLLKDWAVMFLPWMLIVGVGQRTIVLAALGMVTTAAAAVALYSVQDATPTACPRKSAGSRRPSSRLRRRQRAPLPWEW